MAINKPTHTAVNKLWLCTWAEGDGAGHQRVAGVEQNHLVLLQLQRRLERRERINHLIASVQHVTVLQTLATCSHVNGESVCLLGTGKEQFVNVNKTPMHLCVWWTRRTRGSTVCTVVREALRWWWCRCPCCSHRSSSCSSRLNWSCVCWQITESTCLDNTCINPATGS